jgi:hypothetical protein
LTGFLCGSPFRAGGYVINEFTHRIIAKSGDFALRIIKNLMG